MTNAGARLKVGEGMSETTFWTSQLFTRDVSLAALASRPSAIVKILAQIGVFGGLCGKCLLLQKRFFGGFPQLFSTFVSPVPWCCLSCRLHVFASFLSRGCATCFQFRPQIVSYMCPFHSFRGLWIRWFNVFREYPWMKHLKIFTTRPCSNMWFKWLNKLGRPFMTVVNDTNLGFPWRLLSGAPNSWFH